MAKSEKSLAERRADKISTQIAELAKVRLEISDYSEIVAELKSEGAKQKSVNILKRLQTSEVELVDGIVYQGFKMIAESKKVEAFVAALPAILKA